MFLDEKNLCGQDFHVNIQILVVLGDDLKFFTLIEKFSNSIFYPDQSLIIKKNLEF